MVLIPGRHRFELLDIRVGLPGASGQKLTACGRRLHNSIPARIDRLLGSRGIMVGSDMENKMALLYKAPPNNAYSHYLPPTGKLEHTALKSTTRYLPTEVVNQNEDTGYRNLDCRYDYLHPQSFSVGP